MPVPRVGAVGEPEIDALHVEFEQGDADVVPRLIDELLRRFEAHAGMHDACAGGLPEAAAHGRSTSSLITVP